VLVGHPAYAVTEGTASFKGKDLWELAPEERSHEGLFLSFQSPIEIPGVSNTDFLRSAYNARMKSLGKPELDPLEFYAYLMPKVRAPRLEMPHLPVTWTETLTGGCEIAALRTLLVALA
jgi:Fe-S cluster assembly ATP-binding protein